MILLRLKKIYLINSLTDFFIILINFFLRKICLKNNLILTSLNRHKKKIIKYYSELVNYKVQNGLYKGIHLEENKKEYFNFSAKLIGCYEEIVQEAIHKIINKQKINYFYNLGCCEGYHFIGNVKKNNFIKSYATDIDKSALKVLENNLKLNKINTKNIFISCNYNLKKIIEDGIKFHETLFLIDIEGDEINFFNHENINNYIKSYFIIEFHYNYINFFRKLFNNEKEKIFYELIMNNFKVEIIKKKFKTHPLNYFNNSNVFNEDDKYLLISESTHSEMIWILLTPKN